MAADEPIALAKARRLAKDLELLASSGTKLPRGNYHQLAVTIDGLVRYAKLLEEEIEYLEHRIWCASEVLLTARDKTRRARGKQ